MTAIEIRGGVELPARLENIELHTDDGFTLVGELALPESVPPVATLVCLHPLPTAGGFMDSHILRKAAARLPALADLAVLRFNFRGVTSPRGTSGGSFGDGVLEEKDLAAAMAFVAQRSLPQPWLLGWSFGTEVAVRFGLRFRLRFPGAAALVRWPDKCGGIGHESLPATGAAKIIRDSIESRIAARRIRGHGHPAHGVEER